jgi:hypothetical protein
VTTLETEMIKSDDQTRAALNGARDMFKLAAAQFKTLDDLGFSILCNRHAEELDEVLRSLRAQLLIENPDEENDDE